MEQDGRLMEQSVGVVVIDADTLVALWSNDAYLAFLEPPFVDDGIVGCRVDEFLPMAAEVGLTDTFENVARTGVPFASENYEYEGFGRGTTYWKWSLQRADGVFGGHGRQLLLLVTDVTPEVERRRFEQTRFERANEQQEFTARVLDRVSIPITYIDRDLTYRQCNQEAAQALGLTREEVIGTPLEQVVGRDSEVFARVKQVVETGQPFVADMDLTSPNGEVRHYAVAYLPDPVDGVIEGAVTTGFDVTDVVESKRRIEEQSRRVMESEATYRAIGELIPYGIWIAEPDGRARYHSPSYQQMTGRTNEELREFGWADLLQSDEIRRRTLKDWQETVRHGDFWDYKHTIRAKDGTWHTILSRGIPLKNELNDVTSWVGINLDITKQERYASFRAALASIMTSIVGNLNVESLLSMVAKQAVEAVGADFAAIVGRDDVGWQLQLLEGAPDERWERLRELSGTPTLSLRAVETGEPQIIPDLRARIGDDPRYEDMQSGIFVPLFLESSVVGVLSLVYTSSRVHVDDALTEFVEDLGRAVSLAMRGATVHEHQRHVSQILQESLLTVPDHLEGVAFAHLYEAAGKDELIGGDFYDAFVFGDKVYFSVGDVSGKGLEAATLTSLTKNALRAHILDLGSPADALTKVNGVVQAFSASQEFVTVFAGVYDRTSGQVVCASAGHPPPLVVSGDDVRAIKGHGPLLGAFDGARYRNMSFQLEEDETLLVYTDGIIEAKNVSGELFGEERLAELARKLDERDVHAFTTEVFDTVREWASGALSDDVAMLGVRPSEAINSGHAGVAGEVL